MPRSRVHEARLRAAEATSSLLIERGATDLTVAEIASSIGVPERTFYRWFPTKQDVIEPLFAWGNETMVGVLRSRADLPVSAALEVAFAEALGGEMGERTRGLVPLVLNDPGFRAVYLTAFHERERVLRPALAERLGLDPAAPRAAVVTACVVAAMRAAEELMVRDGGEPEGHFRDALQALQHGLLVVTD